MNNTNMPKGEKTNSSAKKGSGIDGGSCKGMSAKGYKHGGHVKSAGGKGSRTEMVTHTPVQTKLKKGGSVKKHETKKAEKKEAAKKKKDHKKK